MTGMLKGLFEVRVAWLGLLVLGVALLAGCDSQGDDPVDPGTGGLEPATDQNGIEAATYPQSADSAPGDGSEPAVAASSRWDGAAANVPTGELEDGLRAIPQGEPEPLADPPSFDSAAPISRTPSLPGNAGEFPGRPAVSATGQHPLAAVASPGAEATSGAGGRRPLELPAAVTAGSPPPSTRPGSTIASDGFDRGVGASGEQPLSAPGTSFGPRSLDPAGQAQPIVAGSRRDHSFVSPDSGSADPRARVHAVQNGDSYWTISRQYFGSARYFQALSAYNRKRIPDPRRMRPGMKVLVPSRQLLETRFAGLLPRAEAAPGTARTVGFQIDANGHPVYTVGPDDTLTGIARGHLGRTSRWIQIYRMNRDQLPSPHKLKPGTVLRMPADAARLQAGLR